MNKGIVTLLLCLLVAGCAMIRQSAIDISEEEVENAEAARVVAVNYLSIWPIQSGMIRGALGARIEELPVQAVSAMDELDQLAEQMNGMSDPNDYDLGLSLGLRIRLLGSVVQEALEIYAPDIINLVPILF